MNSPFKNQTFSVGLIQMSCLEKTEENLKKALVKIDEAAKKGAQIICLQELFSSLYFCQVNDDKFFDLAESFENNPTLQALCKKAKEKDVVIIGTFFEKANENGKTNYYNSAVIIDVDGQIKNHYRKLHIPDDPVSYYSEAYYFSPGNLPLKATQTKYAKIGVLICWDQWYPEPARKLAQDGAEIIFYPTAIGWTVGVEQTHNAKVELDAWKTIQRSHAIANTVFVASTNRCGTENKIHFWGNSFVCDPLGDVLDQATADQETVLITTCNRERIKTVRGDWPFLSYLDSKK